MDKKSFLLGACIGISISVIISIVKKRISKKKIPFMHQVTVGNTPIFILRSFPGIIFKAEYTNLGGSPKDRLAYGILEKAFKSGELKEGDTIFEGTVGSTGISLALMARVFGLNCYIVMPDDQAEEKYNILEILGATIEKVKPASIIDPGHFVNIARRRSEEMNARKSSNRGYFINQFENTLNSEIHFNTTGPEIYKQTNGEIDAIVLGSGTGGTMSGVARYLKSKIPHLLVILADPQGSGLYSKVKFNTLWSFTEAEGTRKRHQVDTIVEGVGLNRLTSNFSMALPFIDNAISVTDQEAVDVSRMVLEKEGLFIGSSSAVNIAASLKLQNLLPKGSRIFTILPDHGSRHVSKFWNVNYLKEQNLLEALFGNLDGDVLPTEIESLCMSCEKNGITRLLLTKIPHFREVIIMAFECPHCGTKNNEIQSASVIAPEGQTQILSIQNSKDLSRQVVKAESASIVFKELEFEIPPSSQKGSLSTIEGILDRSIEGLSQDQEDRRVNSPEIYEKVASILQKLEDYKNGLCFPFTMVLDDPAGNSYIENLLAPETDPQIQITHYKRTKEQNEFLALGDAPEAAQNTEEVGITADDLAFKEEVHEFPGNCSRCNAPSATKMHIMDIPYFKDVIIMATTCDSCGYKSNEVKSGGSIAEKGRRIKLILTDAEDFSRDILKSETCGLQIPEIDLELTPGTLGGRFTTVEGLLRQVQEELANRAPFVRGDSATDNSKSNLDKFLDKLENVLNLEKLPVTLILDDPLANSYLQNLYAPDPDPNMEVEEYERSWQQNEDYGLNDLKCD